MWGPNVSFGSPAYLFLLLIVPLLVLWYIRRHRAVTTDIRFPTLDAFASAKPTAKERLRHVRFAVRTLAIIVLIVALARPQSTSQGNK